MDPLFAKILYFVLLAIHLNTIHPYDAKKLLESQGYKMDVRPEYDNDGNYTNDFVILTKTDTLFRGDSIFMIEARMITLKSYKNINSTVP